MKLQLLIMTVYVWNTKVQYDRKFTESRNSQHNITIQVLNIFSNRKSGTSYFNFWGYMKFIEYIFTEDLSNRTRKVLFRNLHAVLFYTPGEGLQYLHP